MARVSFLDPSASDDPEVRQLFAVAQREGTPRPEMIAVGAHDPEGMKLYHRLWRHLFKGGKVEHELKELMRVHVAELVDCRY
jgi:hypothetical protein